ncbi:hypothetical protein QAD02_014278 [Eretmocerus hayati]|uniref:Uncharacterized protein n=1 Tax=Eretmocerus hayati TaxID=131215 RepID=A0ACC2P6J2_9HYME|nr:hypothetical protein QAD02_014278 [Eretmocerus hayati]
MKFALILSAAMLALASAAPKEANPSQQVDITALTTKFQADFENAVKTIKEAFNIPDQEVLIKNIKEQVATFTASVQSAFDKISGDIQKMAPEYKKIFEQQTAELSKTYESLITNVPNGKELATNFKTKLDEGLQTILKESATFAEQVKSQSPDIKQKATEFTQKTVDSLVKLVTDANEQTKKALTALTEKKN